MDAQEATPQGRGDRENYESRHRKMKTWLIAGVIVLFLLPFVIRALSFHFGWHPNLERSIPELIQSWLGG